MCVKCSTLPPSEPKSLTGSAHKRSHLWPQRIDSEALGVSVCLFVCLSQYVCQSVCLFQSVSLSVSRYICLSLVTSVCRYVRLSVFLSLRLPVYLNLCPSVCVSVCPIVSLPRERVFRHRCQPDIPNAHGTKGGWLAEAVDGANVVQRVNLRREAAMETEKLAVHERCQRQAVKRLHARIVHLLRVLHLA